MRSLFLLFMLSAIIDAQNFTRGVGVYPGDPAEYHGPAIKPGQTAYRNLALRRPVYQSSSYDYNLTAQLVTDGIKHTWMPRTVRVWTAAGELPKQEREHLVDDNPVTNVTVKAPGAWVAIELAGGDLPFEIDRVDIDARGKQSLLQTGWTLVVAGSDDGSTWTEVGRTKGLNKRVEPNQPLWHTVNFSAPAKFRRYRVSAEGSGGEWQISSLRFFRAGARVNAGGPFDFTSAWRPAGAGEEWVYVDLGAAASIDRVTLAWIRRAAVGTIEVSNDAVSWRQVAMLGASDDYRLAEPIEARYVRLRLARAASDDGYALSEFEVHGRGGVIAEPKQTALGRWRLERSSEVKADGAALSKPGFKDGAWIAATVPATTLTSFHNAGAVPDPNFGDNQLAISDSYFYSDFWYRTEFQAPKTNQRVWLNFGGINWKADVYLNGSKLGRIEGGFVRARFDVTGKLNAGANALAVRVEKNANPGSAKEKTFQTPDLNGGILGADNPTYHASIGWDWIPTVRGRNTGIWKDVFLSTSGDVTVDDPFVNTVLAGTDAELTVEATLRNHGARPVSGILRVAIGEVTYSTLVTLAPHAAIALKQDSSTEPQLRLRQPKLWWPAGYGDAHLYQTRIEFVAGATVSDAKTFQTGIRQFTFSEQGGALRMWINGRRFIPRGGNWGFGESMLRYRAREYDAAVRYHRDMNFTMIRNWVGQIGDEELYEACDRHGIVVWHDFWLANPWDGPDPDNHTMFLANARDTILHFRNHASVGLYCGRNEGFPPKPIEDGLRYLIADLHPGMHYIPSSADDVVSGHGPYQAKPVKHYFAERATKQLHSELGMPNIMTLDSVRATMPEAEMWPMGRMWGLHDFSLNGAQGGSSFIERIEKSYGGAASAAEWLTLAQFVNYEGYRAMFEAQSKYRMGLLIWMSHPTWPSFVWQTYDYFFEPTAAYFGAKKASEPLHVQWNAATDQVEVVNYSAGDRAGLTVSAEVLMLDGTIAWRQSARLDSTEDSVATPFALVFPTGLSAVHFVRLLLTDGEREVSRNFYWRGIEDGDFRALRGLPRVALDTESRIDRKGDSWLITATLRNPSTTPALMVRLKPVRETSRDRILPAIFSDNYVALMPGESRSITIEMRHADTRGEKPALVVEGFNVR